MIRKENYVGGKRKYEFLKLYLIPERMREDKAKNEQKNFDILKYDGVRAQKMGKLVYAIKCFTEALNIQEDFETMSYLVSAYTMANGFQNTNKSKATCSIIWKTFANNPSNGEVRTMLVPC